jgi:hypothetical protein
MILISDACADRLNSPYLTQDNPALIRPTGTVPVELHDELPIDLRYLITELLSKAGLYVVLSQLADEEAIAPELKAVG